MKAESPHIKTLLESTHELEQALEYSTKQNFQLLQDKVKLEGEIIALKEELNKQLKK